MAVTPAGSLNAAVEHASAILATNPAQARREAEAILKLAANDPRGRLILASARRRLGDVDGALAILQPLAKAFPRAAHTQYELGASLAAKARPAPAAAALRHAVALKPDLAEAWKALGDLLFAEGDNDAADAAFAAHDRALVRDPALRAAAEALYAGRLPEAEQRLAHHLTARPDDVAALRLMAEVFTRTDRYPNAEVLLVHALRLEPAHLGCRFALANAFFQQQQAAEALAETERLLAVAPTEPAYLNLKAACLMLLGDFDLAVATYERLIARLPRQPKVWLNHGHALRTIGEREKAIESYRQAIALCPGAGDAYWSLANLKVATLTEADEAAIVGQLGRDDLAPDDRLQLHYALGKALEDRRKDAEAFFHYSRGAEMRRRTSRYDADAESALMSRSRGLFTAAFLGARQGWGSPADDPIFVVGLPRSGSTLIEQILASHSKVEGTMELSDISLIAGGLGGRRRADYPGVLADLDEATLRGLGETYIERTRVQRRQGRPYFVDKMPDNFRHIGMIHLALPRAKIIDARRHPLGTCFSAFKQHFSRGYGFSYDLAELGRYYRDYVELMAHYDTVLPGRVHRVVYEDLVENTEDEIRRLLDHCGLAFEDRCLRFHENDRAVRTVSSEQVRRPIFRDGLDQWRRFEPWLDPLKSALGPVLEDWRRPTAGRSGV